MNKKGEKRPRTGNFFAPCKWGCGFQKFSHESQEVANRMITAHESNCEKNPDVDPDAIR